MNNEVELVLSRYNNYDTEAEKSEYIEYLEDVITRLNRGVADGLELVGDAVYDTLIDYLRELNPDSPLLHQVWSEDDATVSFDDELDSHLVSHPMMSIQTIKHIGDAPVEAFISKMPPGDIILFNTIKENGHGLRVVWRYGELVKATSRGRSTNGKDLTEQMKLILGERNEYLADMKLVEMRGEALLPFSRLEEARRYNPSIKSAFSGVASMIRASATPEETKLLDVVFYNILCDKEFGRLSEKYEYIESIGFKVPTSFISRTSRHSFKSDLEEIVLNMDLATTDYDYYTDGVVVEIDDRELFEEFGAEDKFRLGNLALKIGRWKQDSYSGIVKEILWKDGKSRKTPVAILEDGVLTATGNTVTNIPLYAPLYIMMLDAYPGNVIHFRYGGEAGVIPVTPDGRLVTDKDLK